MIPISASQILEHKDKESGAIYQFKPLLGDTEMLMDKYYAYFDTRNKTYMKKAEEIVTEKESKGAKFDNREEEIKKTAIEITPGRYIREPEYLEIVNDIIDAVLCGWKHKKFPPFPKDGKPSKMFKIIDKSIMVSAYIKLNELSEDEIKN